jgi:hypothetical protein
MRDVALAFLCVFIAKQKEEKNENVYDIVKESFAVLLFHCFCFVRQH